MSKSKRNTWMLSPALGHALMIVERIVVQNIWQGEQLLYRNVNLVPASLCAVVHACMCVRARLHVGLLRPQKRCFAPRNNLDSGFHSFSMDRRTQV